MVGILAQFEAFLLTFFLGIAAGLIFHYYQLTIRNITLGRYSLYLLDFFLWMGMICVVSVGILLINQGEVRIYVFISLVLGILLYFRKIARLTSPALQKTATAGVLLTKKTISLMQYPFRLLVKIMKVVFKRRPPTDPPLPTQLEGPLEE